MEAVQAPLLCSGTHEFHHPDRSRRGEGLALGDSIGSDIPAAPPRRHRRDLRRVQVRKNDAYIHGNLQVRLDTCTEHQLHRSPLNDRDTCTLPSITQ